MQGDTIEMQSLPDAPTEAGAIRQPSYLGEVLAGALALFTFTRLRQTNVPQPDGLEALDMLGGWRGADGTRKRYT